MTPHGRRPGVAACAPWLDAESVSCVIAGAGSAVQCTHSVPPSHCRPASARYSAALHRRCSLTPRPFLRRRVDPTPTPAPRPPGRRRASGARTAFGCRYALSARRQRHRCRNALEQAGLMRRGACLPLACRRACQPQPAFPSARRQCGPASGRRCGNQRPRGCRAGGPRPAARPDARPPAPLPARRPDGLDRVLEPSSHLERPRAGHLAPKI